MLLVELFLVEDELLDGVPLLVEVEVLFGEVLLVLLIVEDSFLDGVLFIVLLLINEVAEAFVGFIIEVNLLLEIALAVFLLEVLSLVVLTLLLETVEEFLVLILSLA